MKKLALVLIAALMASPSVYGCAACMGTANEHIAPALNASMGLLLGFICAALAGFLWFIIYLGRRDGVGMTPETFE